MKSDADILREYVGGSEEAFGEIVRRYGDFVYTAARRQLGDAHLAEDVTQAVFLILSRKAKSLAAGTVLAGWLVYATRYAAMSAARNEARRCERERKVGMEKQESRRKNQEGEEIERVLDEGLAGLSSTDRDVVVLRYLRGKSFGEVSAEVGISEVAAKKRVGRALEKLRKIFMRRGVIVPAAALGAMLAAMPVMAAPASLTAAIGAGGSVSSAAIAKGAMQMIAWAKMQFAAMVAAVMVVTGGVGTVVVHEVMGEAAMPVVVAASEPPAVASASAPIGVASPMDPIVKLSEFLRTGDARLYEEVHAKGDAEEEKYSAALIAGVASQRRFLATYAEKLDPKGIVPVPATLIVWQSFSEKQLGGAQVSRVDATTADVTIVTSLTYNEVTRFREVLEGGRWLVQVRPTIAVKYPADPAKAVRVYAQEMADFGAVYDAVEKEIRDGQITSSGAVASALEPRLAEVVQKASLALAPVLTVPYVVSNDAFRAMPLVNAALAAEYEVGVDAGEKRTAASSPALHVKAMGSKGVLGAGFVTIGENSDIPLRLDEVLGKRVRLTAWMKAKDVANWCGPALIVVGKDQKFFAQADIAGRPITGTTDWEKLELVADVPNEATGIVIVSSLRGKGEMWMDGAELEVVPESVPTNDDSQWEKWSNISPQYVAELDDAVKRDGHATMRLSSETAPRNAWCSYGKNNRKPEEFLGKHARLSAWVKTEDVTGKSGMNLRAVVGPNTGAIAFKENKKLVGTTDWQELRVELDVPAQTQCVSYAILLSGSGKLWVDLESVKLEVVGK